ncbi:MAG: glycosyltransferase [Candidatus Methanospirareceae archaeon]
MLLDGDGQHDPAQIPQLLRPIQEGTADIVIGSRELKQMPRYRRVGRLVLDYTTASGKLTQDSQSGFRALGRNALTALNGNRMKVDGFSIESEMIMVARDLQLKIAEVPITCNYALKDTSTENPVRHGFGVPGAIIQTIAEKRPLLYIGLPGMVLIMIGFYFGLTLLRQYNRMGYLSLPFTLLAGFFIIVGVLGVFISLVLNVISRLLQEREGSG